MGSKYDHNEHIMKQWFRNEVDCIFWKTTIQQQDLSFANHKQKNRRLKVFFLFRFCYCCCCFVHMGFWGGGVCGWVFVNCKLKSITSISSRHYPDSIIAIICLQCGGGTQEPNTKIPTSVNVNRDVIHGSICWYLVQPL